MKKWTWVICMALAMSSGAYAATWDETTDGGGDASNFPIGTFQDTTGDIGDPVLATLTGATSSAGGDPHDAYSIVIADAAWSIDSAGFDTRLWLFETDGTFLMSNDDSPAGGTGSSMGPTATWPATLNNSPTDPPMIGEKYILVVSGFSETLHDSADAIMSHTGGFTDLNGIDPGFTPPIDHWEVDVDGGTPASGSYTLTMTGIEFCIITPVELQAFDIASDLRISNPSRPQAINTITWSTASEIDNFGFDVYRGASSQGPFVRINSKPIPGAGTTDDTSSYTYVDQAAADQGKTYWYYVESISVHGEREVFTPTQAAMPRLSFD